MKKLRSFLKLHLWSVMVCLSFSLSLTAQQDQTQKITGKIISKNSGAPLAGATITVRGTNNAVVSNEKGEFSITAAPNETLVLFLVGYTPSELKAGEVRSRSITLEEDYNHLQDVVVVGYGKMKKTDLSSSQVTLTSEELHRPRNATIEQALQAKRAK